MSAPDWPAVEKALAEALSASTSLSVHAERAEFILAALSEAGFRWFRWFRPDESEWLVHGPALEAADWDAVRRWQKLKAEPNKIKESESVTGIVFRAADVAVSLLPKIEEGK